MSAVLSTSAAQQQLVPALMRVYGQADFVVGLDVDKDDYDKFSVRDSIGYVVKRFANQSHAQSLNRRVLNDQALASQQSSVVYRLQPPSNRHFHVQ